jgi:hypothetical protein
MADVFVSCVIDTPVERLWDLLRDFGGWSEWHPGVRQCEIVNGLPGFCPRAVHRLVLSDGSQMQETLLALSDHDRSFAYALTQSDAPFRDYTARVAVSPVTETSQSFLAWSARYSVDASDQAATAKVVAGILAAGFDGLRKRLG